jgi:hypothetical protein
MQDQELLQDDRRTIRSMDQGNPDTWPCTSQSETDVDAKTSPNAESVRVCAAPQFVLSARVLVESGLSTFLELE